MGFRKQSKEEQHKGIAIIPSPEAKKSSRKAGLMNVLLHALNEMQPNDMDPIDVWLPALLHESKVYKLTKGNSRKAVLPAVNRALERFRQHLPAPAA